MPMVPPANFGDDNIMLQRAVCLGNYTKRSIYNNNVHGVFTNPSMYYWPSLPSPPLHHRQLQLPADTADYGLLQDILSMPPAAAPNEARQLH